MPTIYQSPRADQVFSQLFEYLHVVWGTAGIIYIRSVDCIAFDPWNQLARSPAI